jgi:hypothetical protein
LELLFYSFSEYSWCHARENGHPDMDSLFRGNDTARYLFVEVIIESKAGFRPFPGNKSKRLLKRAALILGGLFFFIP